MKNKGILLLLLFSLMLLSACGTDGDEAGVTYIVSSTVGNVGEITYLDGNGQEQYIQEAPGSVWATSFTTSDGNFLFITARSSIPSAAAKITIKILSNGIVVAQGDGAGEDPEGGVGGKVALVSVETFATANPPEGDTGGSE